MADDFDPPPQSPDVAAPPREPLLESHQEAVARLTAQLRAMLPPLTPEQKRKAWRVLPGGRSSD
jgi:hypothetical protein